MRRTTTAMPGLVRPAVAADRSRLVAVMLWVTRIAGLRLRGLVVPRKVMASMAGSWCSPLTTSLKSSWGLCAWLLM